jgi:hypothetical protein
MGVLLSGSAFLLGGLLVAITSPVASDRVGHQDSVVIAPRAAAPLAADVDQHIKANLARLPLSFMPGVADAGADFTARGVGYAIALSPTGLTLALTGADAPVAMRFLDTPASPKGTGETRLPGTVNYFIGNDPTLWRTDVPTFAAVRYHDLYAGIDLLHYGTAAGELEHDLVVAPGADPMQISFRLEGTATPVLDSAGELVIGITAGELRLRSPLIYQETSGGRTLVRGGYRLDGERVGFWLGAYDAVLPLIIDPTLAYSTYLGGSANDIAYAIAVDAGGNAYVAGMTSSTNFPLSGAYQGTKGAGASGDAFVTKLNAAGSALIYSTYLGGNNIDQVMSIAVDSAGNAHVTGETASPNFPVLNAFQGTLAGGADAFVAKLTATGSALSYSTYLGGSGSDRGYGIALDAAGNAYVTGQTPSSNFPVMSAFQGTYRGGTFDAFVTKVTVVGALGYSTYLGGAGADVGRGIAVDSSGAAYITGSTMSDNFPTFAAYQGARSGLNDDAFVTKLNAAGAALSYSTYFGGPGSDTGLGIVVDSGGSAHFGGFTSSTSGFPLLGAYQPTQGGASDAFVATFNAAGGLGYSTYLGGSGQDRVYAIALDTDGNIYVVGETSSPNFPTVNPYQASIGGTDAFVTKFNAAGSTLSYSTFLGGSGSDTALGIAVDSGGNAYVAGYTGSTDFPTMSPFQGSSGGGVQEAFVAKFGSALTVGAISPTGGGPAGGPAVTITGTAFVTGATVTIGGSPATSVVFVSATSLTATTPAHAAGAVNVVVTNPDAQTATGRSLFTYAAAPTVSSISPSGGAPVGGSAVTIGGTGFVNGATVTIGGSPATSVVFVGATSLTATTPAHAAGPVDVIVTNPDTQSGTGTNLFTYGAAPTVSAISPTSGPTVGGTAVTITGTGFASGATVSIGGSAATSVTFGSATSLTAATAAHASGLVDVVVTNPDTQSGTGTNLFTYAVAPQVQAVSPSGGPLAGGTAVAITGTNFVSGATVTIGGSAATGVTFVSPTSLTATTPAHAAGVATVVVTNPDTQSGTWTNFFTYAAAPSVSAISPTGGALAGGTAVSITGSGFVTGATVTIGGSDATSVVFVSASSLTATTPAHGAGAVNVVVTNPDTQSGSGTNLYTYAAAPTITAFSPASGPTAGGTLVTITGTGFTATPSMFMGGSAATSIVFISPTSITATTPAHGAGAVSAVLINPDTQTGSAAGVFTYAAAPTVSAVSPTSGPAAGGTAVTITGTGFVSGATVSIGGSTATSVVFSSSTSLTATTPAHAAGLVNAVVTNPDTQSGSGTNLFTFVAAPTVSAVSPSGGALAGGTTVTISGTGFVSGVTVSIGGTPASGVVFGSATSLTATTPAHAAGVVNVVVTNSDTQSGTGSGLYTYTDGPTVSAISPSGGSLTGGTTVTITGAGFVSGATVTIGGSAATSVVFGSATSLTATTPAHGAGPADVTVTNPDTQSGTGMSPFTYAPAPTVSAISPTSGPTPGGTALTITGTDFISGATVTIGGTSAAGVSVVNATTITATSPAHTAGVISVVVTNPDTQSGSCSGCFSFVAPPTVNAVSPTTGPAAGGTSITISGTGFISGAAVMLGGSAASGVTVVNPTTITATTPLHASGVVTLVVTNPDTQSATCAGCFTYVAAPTVSGISPNVGPVAGGTSITITGTGFNAGATVSIDGTAPTAVVVVDPTTITATTAANAAGTVMVVVTNPDAQSGNCLACFTFVASPTVSGISPTFGLTGGGTSITIIGSDFVSGATVTIGGSAATGVAVVDPTTIIATTPAGTVGTATVTVTNPDTQSGSCINCFTYGVPLPAPTVSAISPTSGPATGGTAITISGTDFISGATVTIGGGAASGVTFISASTITAITPVGSAGAVTVSVTNPDTQSGSCTNCFTYVVVLAAPTVTAITPTSGPAAGGTAITISGSGFIAGATVTIGGSAASGVTVVSPTTMTAITPPGAAGAATLTVTNPDTQSGSASLFSYAAASGGGGGGGGAPPSAPSCAPTNGSITQNCTVSGPGTRVEIPAGTTVRTPDGGPYPGTLILTAAPLPLGPGIVVAVTLGSADGSPFTFSAPALLTLDLPAGFSGLVQPVSIDAHGVLTYFSAANSPAAGTLSVGMRIRTGGMYGLVLVPDIAAVSIASLSDARRPGLHAHIVGESAWPTLEPDQIATLIVLVQNTGDVAWVRGVPTSELRLGAVAPHDNTLDADSGLLVTPLGGIRNRYARQSEAVVAPGGIATMAFQVRAPASGTTRRIDMRPVIDGVAWLEDEGLYLVVSSHPALPAPLLVP